MMYFFLSAEFANLLAYLDCKQFLLLNKTILEFVPRGKWREREGGGVVISVHVSERLLDG